MTHRMSKAWDEKDPGATKDTASDWPWDGFAMVVYWVMYVVIVCGRGEDGGGRTSFGCKNPGSGNLADADVRRTFWYLCTYGKDTKFQRPNGNLFSCGTCVSTQVGPEIPDP